MIRRIYFTYQAYKKRIVPSSGYYWVTKRNDLYKYRYEQDYFNLTEVYTDCAFLSELSPEKYIVSGYAEKAKSQLKAITFYKRYIKRAN
jgi:hypothetical protein